MKWYPGKNALVNLDEARTIAIIPVFSRPDPEPKWEIRAYYPDSEDGPVFALLEELDNEGAAKAKLWGIYGDLENVEVEGS